MADGFEEIAERLRARRAELERDMDDTDKNIRISELLDRIQSLQKRIDATRPAPPTVHHPSASTAQGSGT